MTLRLGCLLLVLGAVSSLLAGNDQNNPSNWTPVKIPGRQPAPEFAGIAAWINSKSLEMSEQKGKVVVIHFLAFG
jgi:hypothetical protein